MAKLTVLYIAALVVAAIAISEHEQLNAGSSIAPIDQQTGSEENVNSITPAFHENNDALNIQSSNSTNWENILDQIDEDNNSTKTVYASDSVFEKYNNAANNQSSNFTDWKIIPDLNDQDNETIEDPYGSGSVLEEYLNALNNESSNSTDHEMIHDLLDQEDNATIENDYVSGRTIEQYNNAPNNQSSNSTDVTDVIIDEEHTQSNDSSESFTDTIDHPTDQQPITDQKINSSTKTSTIFTQKPTTTTKPTMSTIVTSSDKPTVNITEAGGLTPQPVKATKENSDTLITIIVSGFALSCLAIFLLVLWCHVACRSPTEQVP